MAWYNLFALYYDMAIESLYVQPRAEATEALDLQPGHIILDLPVGTGQSLDGLWAAVQPDGRIVGVDLSTGMLAQARKRVARKNLTGVELVHRSVHDLDGAVIAEAVGQQQVDRLHIFLGLSAIPDWEAAFDRMWAVLKPGGRAVIVDVHADPVGLQGHMVQLNAGADLKRKTWTRLEALGEGFERRVISTDWRHGGALWLATATKPAG